MRELSREKAEETRAESEMAQARKARVSLATSFLARIKGLLGAERGTGMLLLAPCRSIHTIGMSYPIDVAFFDRGGLVLLACRDVAPGARLSCCGAAAAVERPSDAGAPWFEPGAYAGMLMLPSADDRSEGGHQGQDVRDGKEGAR